MRSRPLLDLPCIAIAVAGLASCADILGLEPFPESGSTSAGTGGGSTSGASMAGGASSSSVATATGGSTSSSPTSMSSATGGASSSGNGGAGGTLATSSAGGATGAGGSVSLLCGNRMLDAGETCDDGGANSGGCSADCHLVGDPTEACKPTGVGVAGPSFTLDTQESVTLVGNTNGSSAHHAGAVGCGAGTWPDFIYTVTLPSGGDLTATLTNLNFAAAVGIMTTCPAMLEGPCCTAGGGMQATCSATSGSSPAGKQYFVVVGGTTIAADGTSTGAFTLTLTVD